MAEIQDLLAIMARLRDPAAGCPWDLEQDFESISPHTIEEAYEVDEAIAQGDLEALRDELGDLLFQVVFQARLAEEQGAFDFAGVVAAIVDKLVRRHPHVFAGAEAPRSAEGQRTRWEEIKAAERAAGDSGGARTPDPFEGIPRRLPALVRSAKLLGRLERLQAKAGGERAASAQAQSGARSAEPKDSTREGLGSLAERAADLAAGLVAADADGQRFGHALSSIRSADGDNLARLVGQGLRAWVRIARHLGIDAEQALRRVDDEAMAEARGHVHQAGSSRRR